MTSRSKLKYLETFYLKDSLLAPPILSNTPIYS